MSDISNIVVSKQFPVVPWIFNAGLVIHSGCSTAIESVLLEKTCISYEPDIGMEYAKSLPSEISLRATSESDVVSFVNDILASEHKNLMSDNQKDELRYYINFSETTTASEKIVDLIDSKYNTTGIFEFYKSIIKKLFFFHTKIHSDKYKHNFGFPYTSKKEAKENFRQIHEALGNKFDYKLDEIYYNCFLIQNKKRGCPRSY